MRIRTLTAFEVPIRLKKPVRHASHLRTTNDTVVIRCELDDGSVGWGEGLPRSYVTGESIGSVRRHLEATNFAQLADVSWHTIPEAVAVLDSFQLAEVSADENIVPRECFGNAVRCAVEISILDAVCRTVRQSFGDVVWQLPESAVVGKTCDEVFYSGAVTSESPGRQWLSALKMKIFGFRQLKVKVGAAGIDDVGCLRRIRRIVGDRVDLRLDANEAWTCENVVSRMRELAEFRPTSLEQPVPHGEVAGLADVRRELGAPVMLDESLCCRADADRAIAGQTCDLFNLRLSKCGGFVSCVRLAALARQHDLGWQLGCQVGETGILSAAGRHFACNVDGIRYLEGSFDRFLVRDALTMEDLTFRYGGRAPRLDGPGLGITVNEDRVRSIAVRTRNLIHC